MKPVFLNRLLNIVFSICFSGSIFHLLGLLFSSFTSNLIFVIMFVCLTKYVHEVVEYEDNLNT
ncbi:hypothetical protein OKW23_000188 [Bacilli bacterium PM5-9]|nr:hypothetical protein [Bacilli bacterium PM5-9]